jgi:inorganic pyrophosphatase
MTHVDLSEQLLAFVEIPKGGRNKYEYDEESGRIVLDRFLSSSMVYPADYGFLIDHRGEDGDPLDCLVCVSEATFPGCVIPVNPVAMFEMKDEAGIDVEVGAWLSREDAEQTIREARIRQVEYERGRSTG